MELTNIVEKRIICNGLPFRSYLLKEDINKKVTEIAAYIDMEMKDKNPLFLGILNGCFVFMADLVRRCKIDPEISFVKLTTYEGTTSTEEVKLLIGLDDSWKDRHIVIIEDIIDSGLTMNWIMEQLDSLGVASLSVVSLLVKPEAMAYQIPITISGFDIPNDFVIGYGLDYNGKGRNLEDIYVLAGN
jgi:hypoxanthine phosphoribosyltransferase